MKTSARKLPSGHEVCAVVTNVPIFRAAAFFLLTTFSFSSVLASEITVAVAANVQYAFEEIKADFSKEKKIDIKTVLGSSGKLTAQIKNGAPFDVFVSADTEYPEALRSAGFGVLKPKIYGYGTLVLWTLRNYDLSKGLNLLKDPAIKKIALANPKTAPYGREAMKAIVAEKLEKELEAKFVYGDSITQASQFVVTQAADIGFTAKSIVLSAEMLKKGKWIEVPANLYSPIAQAAILLKGKNQETARVFFDYLYSEKARNVFSKYGYKLP